MWVGKPWKHSGGRWSAEQIKLATNVQLMRIHLHLLHFLLMVVDLPRYLDMYCTPLAWFSY